MSHINRTKLYIKSICIGWWFMLWMKYRNNFDQLIQNDNFTFTWLFLFLCCVVLCCVWVFIFRWIFVSRLCMRTCSWIVCIRKPILRWIVRIDVVKTAYRWEFSMRLICEARTGDDGDGDDGGHFPLGGLKEWKKKKLNCATAVRWAHRVAECACAWIFYLSFFSIDDYFDVFVRVQPNRYFIDNRVQRICNGRYYTILSVWNKTFSCVCVCL